MSSKNLTYYFPDSNNATGLKVFKELGTSLTGFYFTKSNLANVIREKFATNYAIYFLFDEADDSSVYIGQSTNGALRIRDHVRKKDFWTYCIMIVSDNDSFDKTVIDYLEYYFINLFKKTIYNLDNKEPRTTAPTIDRFIKSTYENYANQIHFLLEASGINFMDNSSLIQKKDIVFYEARKSIDAKLFFSDGLFVLASGSVISRPKESSKEWNDNGAFYKSNTEKFNNLVSNGKAVMIDDSKARLVDDVPFKTPSAPAELCSGYAENGWVFWKGLDLIREKKDKKHIEE